MITLELMDHKGQMAWAQWIVKHRHYLKAPVDSRCSVEGYQICLDAVQHKENRIVGLFLFGRPEATRCSDWYGGVEDVAACRCEVTRWQVLNLARVWLSTRVQPGGELYKPDYLPGFTDRKGQFRSTLASDAINLAAGRIGFDYLMARPPCFLDEPYEIKWLLSYCDTRLHKGTIYRAAGFELYRTNKEGIQTWRKPLEPLTAGQDEQVQQASHFSQRSQSYRGQRLAAQSQLSFEV